MMDQVSNSSQSSGGPRVGAISEARGKSEKISNGASRVKRTIVGLLWVILGFLALFNLSGAEKLFGLLCWAYAIWLFVPGKWRLLIY
jgi:hypothetical protein